MCYNSYCGKTLEIPRFSARCSVTQWIIINVRRYQHGTSSTKAWPPHSGHLHQRDQLSKQRWVSTARTYKGLKELFPGKQSRRGWSQGMCSFQRELHTVDARNSECPACYCPPWLQVGWMEIRPIFRKKKAGSFGYLLSPFILFFFCSVFFTFIREF